MSEKISKRDELYIKESSCDCIICKDAIPFEFDSHLLSEIENDNVVLFAGAGISTESKQVFPDTFYEQISAELDFPKDLSFPQLMTLYECQPNGRQKLIAKIQERFDHINSWQDMRRQATAFHSELGTMPYFDRIITTNWDRYFEEYSGATPFVYDSDIVFWDLAKRAVLKIHGSIDNYSSIVATTADYELCENRLRDGAMGAALKQTLSTKTCVFIGYSLSDTNFLQIYNIIKDGLGHFARTHYYVSPYVSEDDHIRLSALNIKIIQTSGVHFLSTVKAHMCAKFCYAEDDTYELITDALIEALDVHHNFVASFRPSEEPHLICCSFYQDGLIHALIRISDLNNTGKYSDLHKLQGIMNKYDQKISAYLKAKNYCEFAYFTGYVNGLYYFLLCNRYITEDDVEDDFYPPMYFHPKVGELFDLKEFDEKVRKKPQVHKGALKQCTKLAKRMGNADVVQRMPWG